MKFKHLIIFIFMFISYLATSFSRINCKNLPKTQHNLIINIPKLEFFRLKNGLTVICVENNKYPIIQLSIDFDRNLLSQKNKIGIENIFGEMLRSGTKNYTKEQFDDEIDQMGTSLFVSSNKIYFSSLKRYFIRSLSLIREMIMNTSFDNIKEFKKLIKRSLTELEINKKNPSEILSRVRNKIYYGNHPYGEYATSENLMNIKLEDFSKFYKKYFGPKNTYLTFVGDITKKEAYKLAEKYFSNWKEQTIFLKKYKLPEPISKIEIDVVDLPFLTQSVISIGGIINFKKSYQDYFSAILANKILGGGPQSRLFLNLREDKGYTYSIYSILNPNKYIGFFQVLTQVRTEVTTFAIQEILKEINKIKKENIKDKELSSFKNEMSGHFILGLEDPQSIARFIVEEFTEKLNKNFYQNYIKNLKSVTTLEISKSAKKYIPENLHIIIIGNLKKIIKSIKKMGYPIYMFDTFGQLII